MLICCGRFYSYNLQNSCAFRYNIFNVNLHYDVTVNLVSFSVVYKLVNSYTVRSLQGSYYEKANHNKTLTLKEKHTSSVSVHLVKLYVC